MRTMLDEHNERLRGIDPLLPSAAPLPEPGPADVLLEVSGGVGFARLVRADLSTLDGTWNPAERHVLLARIGADDPVAAMDALLSRWRDVVHATIEDAESSAIVTWPARDVAMTRLFLDRALAPRGVFAVRMAGRPMPQADRLTVVRPITDADVDAAAALELELVRMNQQLGQMIERPNTAELIHAKYAADVRPWCWLAEVDGEAVGLLTVLDPKRNRWPDGLTSAGSAAYVSDLMVIPSRRGAGVGTALVRRAHAALDEAGLQATVLSYLGMNPLSGPFWHRCGYRPLTVGWETRPATHLR